MSSNILLRNRCPVNKILKWYPSDDKPKYMENVKYHKEQLDELEWDQNSIEYQFDSHGFRNDLTFNTVEEYNLVLGCSHSFGIGVCNNEIWFNYLKDFIDGPFYNGSIAGCSPHACLRTLKGLRQEGMKVKRVFMFIPDSSRYEIYNDEPRWNAWDTVAWWTDHAKHVGKYLLNENFLKLHYDNVLESIELICNTNKIEYVLHPTDGRDELDMMISNDRKGRDLLHPGIDAHKQIGQFFYDRYSEKYNSST